ncbi:hypothetical protein CEXT_811781 [Caerostris extrusa]|uniref:Uncharacterized protein n=1 Tax=Caerostris extrusa TaxID=172846 RepID=A0AAV4NIV8_CAEEX|nr:hypothetical protein CEXT_811781 [Caerostris extrusa]
MAISRQNAATLGLSSQRSRIHLRNGRAITLIAGEEMPRDHTAKKSWRVHGRGFGTVKEPGIGEKNNKNEISLRVIEGYI